MQGVRDELTAESMRAATIVGLASVPIGFVWAYLVSPQSGVVLVLAGMIVGVLYSDRPTPAHRAGARTGMFAPLPVAIAQSTASIFDLWATSMALEVKIFFISLVGFLGVLFLWVLGALICIVSALLTAAITRVVSPHLPEVTRSRG